MYPEISAKTAREKAQAFLKSLQDGINPVEQKAQKIHDFKSVFEIFFDKKRLDGLSEKTLKEMRSAFKAHVIPKIGKQPVNKITIQDCIAIQKGLQDAGTFSTADKIRSWLNRTFRYAMAAGLTDHNPASYLVDVSVKWPKSQNFPYLLEEELPDFLKALKSSTHSNFITLSAAWLVIYTASRPRMVRWAEWSEFDLEGKAWTIPAEKMKTRKEHVIPLTTQVLSLLEELKPYTAYSNYLFPSDYAVRQACYV